MTNFLLPILTTVAKITKNQFIKKTHQPTEIQTKFLFKLLKEHQDTELGKKYNFRNIKTVDQFRENVPILPYNDYEPYLERIAKGEQNILTKDQVIYITLTSGSTGKKKLIPTTKKSQAIVRDASLLSIGFVSEGLEKKGLKFGKMLVTNCVQQWGKTEGGIDFGPSSAGVLKLDKRLYKQFFAHPYEIVQVSDSISRHYLALLFALCEPEMGGMIANFPMLILRTCNYLEKYAEDLIKDIEKGTIANWLDINSEIRTNLEASFSANPKRAKELSNILEKHGKLTPKLAWPNLSMVANARGGTSDFYFERFPYYFENTPIFGVVFSSAEGIFSIYPDVDTDGSVLALESGFFEFIPQSEWLKDNPKTLLATEVKVGEKYRILTSSYNGFYRYDIGDVIEVVGFYNKTPLIVFKYRQKGQMSATTEKTNEAHITQVMQRLLQEFKVTLEDFCFTLSENDFPARYLVNIELANSQKIDDYQTFLGRCDQLLGEVNTHYQISRKSDIPEPYLRILAPGSFAIIRQRYLEKGIPDSQLKFPHLSEDRKFLEGITIEKEVKLVDN
jgi:GH3 auxin-responsive promoter